MYQRIQTIVTNDGHGGIQARRVVADTLQYGDLTAYQRERLETETERSVRSIADQFGNITGDRILSRMIKALYRHNRKRLHRAMLKVDCTTNKGAWRHEVYDYLAEIWEDNDKMLWQCRY